MEEKSFVYLLRCADGSLYAGWTNDPVRRVRAHNEGKGAKYTKARRPVVLIYLEACRTRSEGLKREYEIKQMSRAQKWKLIAQWEERKRTCMNVPMRRKQRERDAEFALEVLKSCPYATLATVNEDGSPYCVPISPAYYRGAVYFHCALKGRKLDNLLREPRVCLSCAAGVVDMPEEFSTAYRSCVLFGHAELVDDPEEKVEALRVLCQKHAPSNLERFDEEVRRSLPRTGICKITIDEIKGKQKEKR